MENKKIKVVKVSLITLGLSMASLATGAELDLAEKIKSYVIETISETDIVRSGSWCMMNNRD